MKSRRFTALATLADAGADLRRRHLDGARADLERLKRQRRELGEHARRYEREGLERAPLNPVHMAMLRHRREFVACLVRRVETLGVEIVHGEGRVREAASLHAKALAKGRAIDTLRTRSVKEEVEAAARKEQHRSVEAWRGRTRSACRGRT